MRLRKITLLLLLTVLSIAVLIGGFASASIPKKINYQGRVTDTDTGETLPGSHSMTFRIFDVESGGLALWTETQGVTADEAGVVSVILGNTTPIDISSESALWLEVEVNGEVLSPRRELVSVPFALRADDAERSDNADSLGG